MQQQQQKQVSLGGGVSVCRPSGSRWTPTAEQLRILKELYYGCGVRSPTAEQIQRITAMLRQHGKIEGKNVFYWFQNHKARERQKKRLTNLDVNNNVVPAAADVSHLGILSLSPSSGVIDAGATSPSSTLGMYTGNGGASAMHQLDTTADWDNTAMATAEGCFLQDYMGVRGTGSGVHGGVAASPWAWFSSPEQRTMMTTRAPETLPLFPTGDDDNRPRPRQGGPPPPGGDGSYYLPDLPFWGAAAPTAATTSTTTVTIQQHQLVQMQQQQYSFYSSSSNQMPSHETHQQDTAAGASLELSLSSSSWCSQYHAGRTM
ncbi:hypothetical protein PR202_gb14042 [Eleusine coracana subsp. coracana]|uniref:Homeobox domain-containing protein n=1 Tax=Eleusine coracana subsp. coracana TaxID=191504 RepID=A0AAV5EU03_ELECO|nr:hypothetical protein PR202_gb14042 [Eleusine coracana subsp. coracana]